MNRKRKNTPKWKDRLRLNISLPCQDEKQEISTRIRRISEDSHSIPYKDLKFGTEKGCVLSDSITNRVERVTHNTQPFALKIFKLLDSVHSNNRYKSILREIRALHAYTKSHDKNPEKKTNEENKPNALSPARFHEFIIRLHDVYRIGGSIQLLLEYMNKGSLRHYLSTSGAISERIVSLISYNVLTALLYLGDQSIVHRDIKPGNILLNDLGFCKLGDFDLCKRPQHNNSNGTSPLSGGCEISYSATKGTYLFMSPQQIMGEKHICFKTDVYSLGISMLECVLGMFPYEYESGEFDPWMYLDYLRNDLHKMNFFEDDEQKTSKELSEEFIEFVKSCTIYHTHLRPTAKDMLKSKFITKYNNQITGLERREILREWICQNI